MDRNAAHFVGNIKKMEANWTYQQNTSDLHHKIGHTLSHNTIQYNTIELYCPVNGKFVCSVRVKVNKNTIVIKKIRINKYIKNEHLNFYQHN